MDYALTEVAVIAMVFLLAGMVKGVIGLGLPTVSLGLLTVAFDLPTAMALMIVPSLLTNVWQAVVGGNGAYIVKRTWPFLLTATATIALGALALTRLQLPLLSALLGLLLVCYAAAGLAGFRFAIGAGHETSAGILFGLVNGVLTGMTGSFVVPGVMYLQGLGFDRDALIQAMGMLFALSTLALAVVLASHDLMNGRLGTASLLALAPAVFGMVVGQRIRQRLPEERFRRVFFVSLLVLGGYIALRSSMQL